MYYNKQTYLVIRYYTVLIYGFRLISDHHGSHLQIYEELLIETRYKDWNYKFRVNLHKECLKYRLLSVDQDFAELDSINKKKRSTSSPSLTVNSLTIPNFEIAYQELTERQRHERYY
jgi:hypothetical protein